MAVKNQTNSLNGRQCYKSFSFFNVVQFLFLSMLLIIPVYAIVDSAINRNWIMMIIDALLVPVGFVHGVLLLFGVVD